MRLLNEEDRLLFLPNLINENQFEFKDDVIGIVSPTYSWGLPSIVYDFLKKAKIEANYIFYVSTYGTTPGFTATMAKKLQPCLKAFYSVQMVDTWTVLFDLSEKCKLDKWTKNTEKQLDTIINMIGERKNGNFMQRRMPVILGKIAYSNYSRMRKTAHFHVEDSCIGCGLCARKCPVHAIEMKDKKPVWIKDKCTMCLGCLHRCTKFAIQYGNKTKKHGQYQNPNVKI